MKTVKRPYQQTVRAERSLAHREEALHAVVDMLRSCGRLDDITLDDVAHRAGVTVRTLLRQFGSRDALLEAAFALVHDDVVSRRAPPPGDIPGALRVLLEHYEADGDFTIRALAQEPEYPLLQQGLKGARADHRAWLGVVFADALAALPASDAAQLLTELYAATDVYLWKLLRRDFRMSFDDTLATFTNLVMGVLHRPGLRTISRPESR